MLTTASTVGLKVIISLTSFIIARGVVTSVTLVGAWHSTHTSSKEEFKKLNEEYKWVVY